MTLRIVRLGTPRQPQEGTRIGAVRRPPRGVRKERYAADDWFDVWYPDLAPSAELVARALAATTEKEWDAFVRAFRAEMNQPSAKRTLELLAALSQTSDFSLGCYCEDEARCHRSASQAPDRSRGKDRLTRARSRLSAPRAARTGSSASAPRPRLPACG